MTRCLRLIILLSGITACAVAHSDAKGSDQACLAETLLMAAAPSELTRGETVDLNITWSLDRTLSDVQAQLALGAGDTSIAVVVPLVSDEVGLQRGSLLNPFGVGAPAGEVSVLATGSLDQQCAISAATTLVLH